MSKKVTVLVVEDDESMMEYVSVVLERLGFEVTQASTGREVVAALAVKNFDIVMTDHLTVDYKGTSVLSAVKMLRPGAEVIVMSGIPTLEEAATSYLKGAKAYLAKPFGLDQLRSAVMRCLEAAA
ncbi:MAG: response regulator [Elusimicrobiota bacterium]|jgi:two-component system response regulator PilR (NtrC family)